MQGQHAHLVDLGGASATDALQLCVARAPHHHSVLVFAHPPHAGSLPLPLLLHRPEILVGLDLAMALNCIATDNVGLIESQNGSWRSGYEAGTIIGMESVVHSGVLLCML